MLSMVVPMVFVTTIWFATFLAVVLTTVYMVIPMGSRAVSCAFRGMSFGLYVVSPLVFIVPPMGTPVTSYVINGISCCLHAIPYCFYGIS